MAETRFLLIVTACLMIAGTPIAAAGPPPGGYLDEAKYPNVIRPSVQFGSLGLDAGQLAEPLDVEVLPDGRIVVAECENRRVQVFDATGASLALVTSPEVKCPAGVAVSDEGLLYVADRGANRIHVFTLDGEPRGALGSTGTRAGEFRGPTGVAVAEGRVHVADTGNARVQVLSLSGDPLLAFGEHGAGDGQFNQPAGVAVDGIGNMYVADMANNRIQKFDPDGAHVASWGTYGSYGGDLAEPADVEVVGEEVYVADLVNHRIQVFDTDGRFLYQWGRHPPLAHEGQGRMHYPRTLGVAPGGAFVVVCEPFESRCQRFDESALAEVQPVSDSAWWEKGTRFHYGRQAVATACVVAVSEIDTHSVLLFGRAFDRELGTESLKLIDRLGGYGTAPGQIIMASNVAADPSGRRLFVSDHGNDRVQVFSLEPRSLGKYIASFGGTGEGPGQLREPGGIDVGPDGRVYVSDSKNYRIQVFDAETLEPVDAWGSFGSGPGEFNDVVSVALDPTGQRLYVTDMFNYRVQVFDTEGNFLNAWGKPGTDSDAFGLPFALDVGADGSVFVSDTATNRIVKFDPEGRLLAEWGRLGTGDGEFYKPKGVSVDPVTGNLYVIDFGNHRGQIFSSGGKFLRAFGLAEDAKSPPPLPLASPAVAPSCPNWNVPSPAGVVDGTVPGASVETTTPVPSAGAALALVAALVGALLPRRRR